jgi:hypothetical protein
VLTPAIPASETDAAGSNRLLSDEGNSQFRWRVQTYTSDTSVSPVYFLWLNPNGGGYTSHYFNMTAAKLDTSTSEQSSSSHIQTTSATQAPLSNSLIPSSTTSASSSAIMPQSVPASPSQTDPAPPPSTAPASSNDSDSSETTLKVGFGVGLGVGIPLILLAGVWIGLKVVKQRRAHSRSPSPSLPLTQLHDHKEDSFGHSYSDSHTNYHGGLHEACSEPQLYEVSDRAQKPVELSS